MSAGDPVLAESYFQHAEHYPRFINEANEEIARHAPQQSQQQPYDGNAQPAVSEEGAPQPVVDGLNDLDQGFLVGPRGSEAQPSDAPQPEQPRTRNPVRQGETGSL